MKISRKIGLPQAQARGPLRWWGKFRFMYGHAVFYVGIIQLSLIAAVAYNTTVQPWVAQYLGWNMTFWQYCVILVAVLSLGMVLEFMFGVPALIAIANEQQYKHESPIKADMVIVKQKQDDLESKLNNIMKHMGIEETVEETEE